MQRAVINKPWPESFKGAIFDLDGTLLESLGVWKEIDHIFLARRGYAVPDDYVEAVMSMGFQQCAEYTIERFRLPNTPEEVIQEWKELAQEAYAQRVPLKPYAAEYLRFLAGKGVKLGVATALLPALYEPCLKRNGIYSLFSAFTSLKEVSRGKGFPDIYLLTAERLNLLPSQCIVFEDIYDGILGANAGGFYTCAVYDQYSEHHAAEIQKACGRYIQSFQALL